MIDVQLDGNWMGCMLALNQLPNEVHSSAIWGQRKVSEKLAKAVKKHINAQDLGWAPRSSSYNPSDPRTLVNSEAYYHAIKSWKQGTTYYAGVKTNAFNAKGDRIVDYANMNEYGGGNLPARPLWAPSIDRMGGQGGIRKIVVLSIYAKVTKLKALGFDVILGSL